jgi:hypothetical protein
LSGSTECANRLNIYLEKTMKVRGMSESRSQGFTKRLTLYVLTTTVGLFCLGSQAQANGACTRTLTAEVVAFDMPLMWNRFGAQNINGQMFALKRDVINLSSGKPLTAGGSPTPGDVALRPDKRPRPLVLRLGAGDCLTYRVTNLLTPARNPFQVPDPRDPNTRCNLDTPPTPGEVRSGIPFNCEIDDQVADRRVSLNFQGTELVNSIAEDGSFVGQNNSSLINDGTPGPWITITAKKEGTYLGTSYGATFGGEGLNGMAANGLWAVLNVGPVDSAFYRSQTTREELDIATAGFTDGTDGIPGNDDDQPLIDFEATYPAVEPWISEDKAGRPILNMVQSGEIVHSDINAVVAYGPSFELANAPGQARSLPESNLSA